MVLLAGSTLAAEPPRVLVLGDSLGAAYGIPVAQGWVARLQQRLRDQGYPHLVVNASVSGETSAGGLARLPAALDRHRPQIVLIELGGNDGLRGLPVATLRENLTRMVQLARARAATPVLFEMYVPGNYGPAYGQAFTAAFGEVAKATQAPLVPFFLGTFATDPAAFQEDGIHPTVASQTAMLEAVWPTLVKLLRR